MLNPYQDQLKRQAACLLWLHKMCAQSQLCISSGRLFSQSLFSPGLALFVDLITRRSAPRVEGNCTDMQVALKSPYCSPHWWPHASLESALISVKAAILWCVDVYPSQRNNRGGQILFRRALPPSLKKKNGHEIYQLLRGTLTSEVWSLSWWRLSEKNHYSE